MVGRVFLPSAFPVFPAFIFHFFLNEESRRQPRAAAGGSAARGCAGKARVPGSVFRRKGSVLAD